LTIKQKKVILSV